MVRQADKQMIHKSGNFCSFLFYFIFFLIKKTMEKL